MSNTKGSAKVTVTFLLNLHNRPYGLFCYRVAVTSINIAAHAA